MHTVLNPPFTLSQLPAPAAFWAPLGGAPLALSPIHAGFPSPATDYLEGNLDLNEYLIQHKAATFFFNVRGASMRGAGIFDGDIVAVDRSRSPVHGQIVVAVVDDAFTIKRLFKRAERIELRAENKEFMPITFTDGQELQIWGVVVGSVRRYK